MAIYLKSFAVTGALFVSLSAAAAPPGLSVTWKDLARPSAGKAEDAPLSAELEGKAIRLEGYLLPVDREDDLVYEFMLVPWVGACSHMPQPPVNQMVLVTPAKPYKLAEAYEPVTVIGTLDTGVEKTQFFLLDGVIQLEVGYSMGRAEVVHSDGIAAPVTRDANPWKFLKK